MAQRWRIELDKFMKDESRNACSMKYTMKGRAMSISFLDDLLFFSIEMNGDAQVTKVETGDDDLLGYWIDTMKEYIAAGPKPLIDFLDKATEVYLSKEDGEKTAAANKAIQENIFDEHLEEHEEEEDEEENSAIQALTNEIMGENFDELPLESPSTQKLKDMQRAQMNKFLEEQVKKTVSKLEFDDFVKQASNYTLDTWKQKKADKDVYVRFFNDNIFTIDNGPPRLKDDPNEKKILESFAKGFVPREVCGDAQDVDLHVLHIDKNYQDFLKDEQEDKMAQAEDEDAAFQQILDQVKQESLAAHAAKQQQEQPPKQPTPSVSKPQPQPVVQKPQPQVQPTPVVSKPKPKFTYKLDEKKPATNIQFRFENNQKVVQKFNLCDPVDILYKFVESHEHSPANGNFVLCIPPKEELTDRKKTLEQMNLNNAALLVKTSK